jgi:hypothetical protein
MMTICSTFGSLLLQHNWIEQQNESGDWAFRAKWKSWYEITRMSTVKEQRTDVNRGKKI